MELRIAFLCLAIVFFGVCFGTQVSSNPCSTKKLLPRANYRGGNCAYNAAKATCDRDLIKGWYRALAGPKDILMQNTPAKMLTCGTKTPYWMNGTFPDLSDGAVSRTVCRANLTSSCGSTLQIQVKSCGSYFVYELPQLPSCSEAYCFGKDDPCPPFEPCDIYEHKPLQYNNGKAKTSKVDVKCETTNASMWYSFTGGEGILSVLNQKNKNCTSDEFTWIKGKPVAMTNGIANHTVCLHRESNTCAEVYHVLSKQCLSYKVYKLPDMSKLSACENLCLDNNILHQGWYTYRIANTGVVDNVKPPDEESKCPADCLWVIGLVAGVVIGAVAATVVVLKMVKERGRKKKVGSSTEAIKEGIGKEGALEKGRASYNVKT